MAKKALVTDTQDRGPLAGLRGLGRAGVEVTAGAPDRWAPGLWSRHAQSREVMPDALEDVDAFVGAVRQLAARGNLVVYPGRDESIDALVDTGDARLAAALPYDNLAALSTLRSKRALPELARAAGLRAPETLYEGPGRDLDLELDQLPAIVKPGASVRGGLSAVAARSERDLAEIRESPLGEIEVVAQEHLDGTLEAASLVTDRDGGVVAYFQQETLATWPREIGVSAEAVSVAPEPELRERLGALLASSDYSGLAQMQMLRVGTERVLIDINTRFYGSLALALASGANLPAVWHGVVVGEPLPPSPRYQEGIVFRWFEARVFAAVRGDRKVSSGRAGAGATWATDDPLPGLAASLTTIGRGVRRRLGRRAG